MQIKKRPKINKPLVALLAVIVLAAAGYFTYAFIHNNEAKSSAMNTPAPTKAVSSDAQQSENLSKNPAIKTEAPNADKPAAPTTTSASSKKQVQMTASTDMSSGTVFIRGGVNYPVTGGSCYAQLTGPSGQSIRKDTTVLQNPATTDCKTISIPTSELAHGKWTFTLHYTSNDYEGVSSEISFSI